MKSARLGRGLEDSPTYCIDKCMGIVSRQTISHHRPSTRPLMIASITVLCADGRVANILPRRMYALSIFSSPLPPPRRTRPDRQTDSTGNAVDTCLVSHNGHVPWGGSEITKGFAMASGHHRHWQCCNCPNREKHASLCRGLNDMREASDSSVDHCGVPMSVPWKKTERNDM